MNTLEVKKNGGSSITRHSEVLMLSKIMSVAVTVYAWVVWLLGIVVKTIKTAITVGDRLAEGAFVGVGALITVSSAIMFGTFVVKCYLATGLAVHLIVLGVLILAARGAMIVWRELKDAEVDTAFHLLAAHLLGFIALIWEATKWIFSKKGT